MRLLPRIASLLLVLVSHLYAAESFTIDCMNLLVEKDDGIVLVSQRNKSYIVGRGEEDGDFVRFLSDLSPETFAEPGLARFIATESDTQFFALLASTESALGINSFSHPEFQNVKKARSEILSLIADQNRAIKQRAQDLRAINNKKIDPEQARQIAHEQLQHESDYVWNELQITKRKAALAKLYQQKLQRLGVDLFAPPDQLAAALKRVDPFEIAKMPQRRFPFKRGEKLSVRLRQRSYLEKKFGLHAREFGFNSPDRYWQRINELAESEDPQVISFVAPTRESMAIYKYNPQTNELLVIGEQTKDFITLYRPTPASDIHPRGYTNTRLSPLQYFLSAYSTAHGPNFNF